MTNIQGFCIILAAVLSIASFFWKPIPWQVPVLLLGLAMALDKFAAR